MERTKRWGEGVYNGLAKVFDGLRAKSYYRRRRGHDVDVMERYEESDGLGYSR